MKRILVIGGTGDQGHPLLLELMDKGFTPVVVVRTMKAFEGTQFSALEKVVADIEDVDQLTRAAKTAEATVAHLPFVFDREKAALFGNNLASAAKAAGHQRIVFNTSCYVHDEEIGVSAHEGRLDIEAAIINSGLPYTIFEPKVFMDNITRSWCKPSVATRDIFAYPCAPTLKINWISLQDVAAFMVASLTHPDVPSGRYAIGGPEALLGDEVAARLSKAAGRTITFKSLTPDQFASAMSMLVTGNPDVEPNSMYDRIASFYRFYNNQPTSPLTVDAAAVAKTFGVVLTPVEVWAKQHDWSDPTDPALKIRMAGIAA